MKPEIKNAFKVLADYCQKHEKCIDCELTQVCNDLAFENIFAVYDHYFGDDQE